MGLLTTEQITAIQNGTARVRQQWTLIHPISDILDQYTILHDGITIKRVVDAGSREVEAYNQTLMEPGELRIKNYSFTLENGDGYLSTNRPGSIWDQHRMLDPIETTIDHQFFMIVDGVETELEFMRFHGSIITIDYKSTGTSKNQTVNAVARIVCNNTVISKMMQRTWSSSDGTETDLNYQVDAAQGEN